MSIKQPQYSVIIPTYNRAKTLALTLDSVCNQTLSPEKYEVIVIDDGSTDDTELLVKNLKFKVKSPEIRYFKTENGGPAKARNLGIKESEGEIIFFTDDNCVAPPNWMETLLDGYIRYPDVVGVGGWIKAAGGRRKYAQRYLDALRQKYSAIALREEKKTKFLDSSYREYFNMSYKKSALLNVGGFDVNFITPGMVDYDIRKRIMENGGYLAYLPFTIEDHGNKNFSGLIKTYFAKGRDIHYWGIKYPKNNFFYFQKLSNFIIYSGVKLIEAKTFFFAELLINVAIFSGVKFAKILRKPIPILSLESKKEPLKTFEIVKKNQNGQIITRFARFNKTEIFSIDKNQFYSIVIPTYNRSRGLVNALNYLIKQTVPKDNYEIIIVNDGSTDDTETQINRLCQGFGGQEKPEIRYFKTENGGPAKARNFGIKQAKGEIVFFTDDDCTVPKDWMETLLAGFKKYPDAAGVGGWIWPPEGELEKSAVSRFLHFESFSGHPIAGNYIRNCEILSNDPLMCFGVSAYNTANVCYKKEILKFAGGFREDFYWPGSEDNELAFRITHAGHQLLYLPFHVIHPKAMSLAEFAKLHFRRGANGYLFRTMHWELLEKLKPGFIEDYGSMASFLTRFLGPGKLFAFIEWLSINAGIRYMKRALKRRIAA